MSWTDKELDELFKGAAAEQSFAYRNEYFKDIEAQLPVRKRKGGFFWWSSAFLSIVLLTVLVFDKSSLTEERKVLTSKDESQIKGVNSNGSAIKTIVTNPHSESFTKTTGSSSSSLLLTDEDKIVLPSTPVERENKAQIGSESYVDNTIAQPQQAEEVGVLAMKELPGLASPELIEQTFKMGNRNRSKTFLYVQASAGMGQSPVRGTEFGSSMSTNYGIAGGIGYRLKNFDITAGIGLSRQHFDNVYIKERSVIYGFGVNTYDQQYHFNSMLSMDVPVKFGYTVGKHHFEGGLNTSVRLQSTVRFHEWKDGITQREGSGVTSTEMFNRIVLSPEVGYAFNLNNNWMIGAGCRMQLGSGISTDRIKGEMNALPLSGFVTIKRTIDLH